jgi:thiol-disulfide isomerase/thioredoxin
MKSFVITLALAVGCTMKSYSQADTSKGIVFEHGVTWQAILQKAQQENKYIFVDCYATWCGPCKWMDKKVYPVDSVGKFMNGKFISVKIQMDKSSLDNDEVREWYTTAYDMENKYNIRAYPSYLVFAGDGYPIHKGVGVENVGDFISMMKSALDPHQQYYTLVNNYREGHLSFQLMARLADAAQNLGEDSLAKRVASDYFHSYLETLPEENLCTKENILFISLHSNALRVDEKLFKSYYRDRVIIDSMMNDGQFCDGVINEVVYRDIMQSQIDKLKQSSIEPNWNQLKAIMSRLCDKGYAEKNLLRGQVAFYKMKKEWTKYIKYILREQKVNGVENWKPNIFTGVVLNNAAYEVFKYGKKRGDLERALSWVDKAIAMADVPHASEFDTKANLLYKLGRKSEALVLEDKSHKMDPGNREISDSFEKMGMGLPTWPAE